MIECVDISKNFGKVLLLDHLTFTIPTGSRTLIKGINGSGKSVLLRMISGFSKPTEGIVRIDGKQLGKAFDFIPSAGIFINSPEFMSNWTGWQNLRYLADIKKIAQDEDIHRLAQLLDLEKDLNKKYRTYSLGMKQKMRIIQALLDKPQYLIFDEPFDALDKKSRQITREMLEDYLNEDIERTLIFTSHNDEMELFATQILEIDDRNLVEATSANN